MHEFGIAENVLRMAEAQMASRGATRIHSITLRIGVLSGVVEEALRFAFEALVRGSPAEGARLQVEPVPLACYCSSCGQEFAAEPGQYVCPRCGRPSADVRRGQELDLLSLEVS